jgi:hypothetical protein
MIINGAHEAYSTYCHAGIQIHFCDCVRADSLSLFMPRLALSLLCTKHLSNFDIVVYFLIRIVPLKAFCGIFKQRNVSESRSETQESESERERVRESERREESALSQNADTPETRQKTFCSTLRNVHINFHPYTLHTTTDMRAIEGGWKCVT